MKYCIVIIDGAAGWPLQEYKGKTCLEIANTPNLDSMTKEGFLGLARTVPQGMEPSSACACMSVFGYDPKIYYGGRSAIEAKSMGIPIDKSDVLFRCNLVTIKDDKMASYSAGHISSEESNDLIETLNRKLGNNKVHFFPGKSYRSICRLTDKDDALLASCTPPHDIPGQEIAQFLPYGPGSDLLRDLMFTSRDILADHPVNIKRRASGNMPANMIWLFWGSGKIPEMPPFKQVFGLNAAITSGVDLLGGLAIMMGMDILDIAGVTDGLDNDYSAQAEGAMKALDRYDLVAIHVEAPDEAGHAGSAEHKIESLERIDYDVIGRLHLWKPSDVRVLIMPDHPTPIELRTHIDEPVPFLLWGSGFESTGAKMFTEAEAKKTGIYYGNGYEIMKKLVVTL